MAHHHQPSHYHRSFAIGTALNILFVLIESFYGWISHSLALLADAGHNFSDVLSLLLAWGAVYLADRPATENRTYGLSKLTILAALLSALILLLALLLIAWQAIDRLYHPQPVPGMTILVVSSIGVLINALTAGLFIFDQHDLNIRGAFLHMLADAAISFGVVIAALIILNTGWWWVDPLLSLLIVLIVMISGWGLLRDSFHLAIDGVPNNINMNDLKDYFNELKPVLQWHDLHVWAMSTTKTALSVHLIVLDQPENFVPQLQKELFARFNIDHATIQIETPNQSCSVHH